MSPERNVINQVVDTKSPAHHSTTDDVLLDEKDNPLDDNDSVSDVDDQNDYYTSHHHSGAVVLPPLIHPNPMLYILGRIYDPINDYTIIRDDESKHLIWFTYRSEFEEIAPYGIKSDAGWGCMFRASQMLLCQALKLHYSGRAWNWPRSFPQRKNDILVQNLLTWFADFPSVPLQNDDPNFNTSDGVKMMRNGLNSWYSLHNMVAAGLANYEVLPGEWLGPQTACYIIRDLCKRHYHVWNLESKLDEKEPIHTNDIQANQKNVRGNKSSTSPAPPTTRISKVSDKPPLRVYVAQGGCIYRPLVEELMKNKHSTFASLSAISSATSSNVYSLPTPTKHPTDAKNQNQCEKVSMSTKQTRRIKALDDPLSQVLPIDICLHHNDTQLHSQGIPNVACPWDTSLLLLIPLRLGLKTFNSDSYSYSLACTFQLPQSLGFVGGSPRHALWFYSALSDGSKLFGLDPHTVHSAPNLNFSSSSHSSLNESGTVECRVDLNDDYLRSVQCPTPSHIDSTRIDPSLALGFYCRDKDDFHSFCDAITQINLFCSGLRIPELFTISDLKPPDYTMDYDFMLSNDLSPNDTGSDVDFSTGIQNLDDEEYVLL